MRHLYMFRMRENALFILSDFVLLTDKTMRTVWFAHVDNQQQS